MRRVFLGKLRRTNKSPMSVGLSSPRGPPPGVVRGARVGKYAPMSLFCCLAARLSLCRTAPE